MQIFINEQTVECQEGITVSALLSQQGIPSANIAVALNDTVVPKTQWDRTVVPAKGQLIIIKAVQGG